MRQWLWWHWTNGLTFSNLWEDNREHCSTINNDDLSALTFNLWKGDAIVWLFCPTQNLIGSRNMTRLFTFSKAKHRNSDLSPIKSWQIRIPKEFHIEFHVWEIKRRTGAGKSRSTIQSPASGDVIENADKNRRWKSEKDLLSVYRLRWIPETINCMEW
jgi:hypothetical protein